MVKQQYCLYCLDSGETTELSRPVCSRCGRFNEEFIETTIIPESIVSNKEEVSLQQKIEQVVKEDESKIKNKIKRTKTK